MTIKTAQFIKGIIGSDEILKDGRKQIAFIGRSNVGKSSVINSLVNKKGFVRSGSMPGRTKQMDFFLINEDFYFVDLPGYGYAQLSEDQRVKLKKMMLWYLFEDKNPTRKVVLIIDAEVGPKDMDLEVLDMLKLYELNVIIVANKSDKIKKSEIIKRLAILQGQFPEFNVILYSTKTNEGREQLWEELLL
ncbi:MAG: ribosome biogenesis GTP-binding protein YihA/YsxC [bacterium]